MKLSAGQGVPRIPCSQRIGRENFASLLLPTTRFCLLRQRRSRRSRIRVVPKSRNLQRNTSRRHAGAEFRCDKDHSTSDQALSSKTNRELFHCNHTSKPDFGSWHDDSVPQTPEFILRRDFAASPTERG